MGEAGTVPGEQGHASFVVRVSAILVESGRLLLVRQKLWDGRVWSLPGGRVDPGESLENACVRELVEETGIRANVTGLLWVGERLDRDPPLLHVTFSVSRSGGALRRPDNTHDANPISDVAFVPVNELSRYGFSTRFCEFAESGFGPPRGGYVGAMSSVGL